MNWRTLLAREPGVHWVTLDGAWNPGAPVSTHELPFLLLTKRTKHDGRMRTRREQDIVLDTILAADTRLGVELEVLPMAEAATLMRQALDAYAQYAASHPATTDARLSGRVAERWLAERRTP